MGFSVVVFLVDSWKRTIINWLKLECYFSMSALFYGYDDKYVIGFTQKNASVFMLTQIPAVVNVGRGLIQLMITDVATGW